MRECIGIKSCTVTLFHMHFEPSHHTIDVSLIVSSCFFRRNSILIGFIDANHFCDLMFSITKKSTLLFVVFTSLLCNFLFILVIDLSLKITL